MLRPERRIYDSKNALIYGKKIFFIYFYMTCYYADIIMYKVLGRLLDETETKRNENENENKKMSSLS